MKCFTIEELSRSEKARQLKIDNTPGEAERQALVRLVEDLLDPLREAYGKPITVTSGYRCPKLNKAVGGAARSHHMRGMAADIVGTPNTPKENRKLFDLVRQLNLPHTQLLHEKGTLLNGPQWVHLSLDPADIRREALYTLNGKTYEPWPFI